MVNPTSISVNARMEFVVDGLGVLVGMFGHGAILNSGSPRRSLDGMGPVCPARACITRKPPLGSPRLASPKSPLYKPRITHADAWL